METHIYLKYAIFISIVYLITCMMYGTPYSEVEADVDSSSAGADGGFDFNPFGFGIINDVVGVVYFVAFGAIESVVPDFGEWLWAGLRFLSFDFSGFPWFLHIFLGLLNTIFIIFFILDFIHGFI